MSNFSLGFLNELTIAEVPVSSPRVKNKKDLNPPADSLRIRLWKDGSVYPSKALVDTFHLEYAKATVTVINVHNEDGTPKLDENGKQVTKRTKVPVEGVVENGLDVFKLSDWKQVTGPESNHPLLLVGVSPKSAPKVELFASSKYNDDGNPQMSVMEQGAKTYGKEVLIPLVEEVYGVTIGDSGYIDLEINTGFNLKSKAPNGLFILPKVFSRGVNAGKSDSVIRENIDVFPMTPVIEQSTTISNVEPVESLPDPAIAPGITSMAGTPMEG